MQSKNTMYEKKVWWSVNDEKELDINSLALMKHNVKASWNNINIDKSDEKLLGFSRSSKNNNFTCCLLSKGMSA